MLRTRTFQRLDRPGASTWLWRRQKSLIAERVSSPCWLRTAAVRMNKGAPGGYAAPACYQ